MKCCEKFCLFFTKTKVGRTPNRLARTGLKKNLITETSPKTIANWLKTRFGALLHILSHIFGSNQPILMQFFCFKAYYVVKFVLGGRKENPANCKHGILFFFFIHRLSTPVDTPNLSMRVKMQPSTYLPNPKNGFLCVWPFLLSHHKGSHTPTSGSLRCFEN